MIYAILNIAGFVSYSLYFKSAGLTSAKLASDYQTNGIVCIIVLSAVCFQIMRVNKNSNQLLKNAFDESRSREEDIRKILDQNNTVSVKLTSSTEEMASITLSFSTSAQSRATSPEEITSTVEKIDASVEWVYTMAQEQAELMQRVENEMETLLTGKILLILILRQIDDFLTFQLR